MDWAAGSRRAEELDIQRERGGAELLVERGEGEEAALGEFEIGGVVEGQWEALGEAKGGGTGVAVGFGVDGDVEARRVNFFDLSGELPYKISGMRNSVMPIDQNRTARLEARIAPDALAVVKRAAELEGRSVSEFVVAAAQEAARRTIEETHLIRLSVEDQRRFVDLLLNPPELSPALERARDAHRRLALGIK